MARGSGTGLIWFFGLMGGAIPVAFTVTHLMRGQRFGMEDVPLWPSSFLLMRVEVGTFLGATLFSFACLLNIMWYLAIGWVVLECIKMFGGRE